uniref:P4Hc domain-containing protein n=1 Tax=Mesocestoides corti TaxID=53468 RepID=A0A5K3FZW0_MESCO
MFLHLLTLLQYATGQNLSQEDRNEILEYHRKLREDVQPTASNMLLLRYSLELEKLPVDWMDYCVHLRHTIASSPEATSSQIIVTPAGESKPSFPGVLLYLAYCNLGGPAWYSVDFFPHAVHILYPPSDLIYKKLKNLRPIPEAGAAFQDISNALANIRNLYY